MDARGYLVCEEVWVEREVEKELPALAPHASKPMLKPMMAAPKPSKVKGPRGMDSIDAEELQAQKDAKEAKKAAKEGKGPAVAKAAGGKVQTGKSSILGFFGKK